MKLYKKEHFDDFKEYAMRDAVIPLHHSLNIMEIAFRVVGRYYLPVTLSSLAQELLSKRLGVSFQLPTKNKKYSVRELARLFTPKGIELSGGLADYLPYYMASLRGGRNESYVYGRIPGPLHDLDLPNAYTTALSLLAMPDYKAVKTISSMNQIDFLEEYGDLLIHSYTALKIEFCFPEKVKYPNLGVRLDDTSLIFPLSGITYCTGLELRLAVSLGCQFTVLGGRYIPFKKVAEVEKQGKQQELGDINLSTSTEFTRNEKVVSLLKECESALKTSPMPTVGSTVEGARNSKRKNLISSLSLTRDEDVPTEGDISIVEEKEFDKSHGFEETQFFELMD